MSTRYALVGSGIAALSAAEEIRRRDPGARITIVSPERHRFYSRPGLPYFLDGTIPESRLAVRTSAELRALDLERIEGAATALDPGAHRLMLQDGRELPYDRLLLATGAASIEATFPGANLPGVFKLDGLDDARTLAHASRPGRTAVIVGGGSTALELVEALAARRLHTHYLLRGDRCWGRVLDPAESRHVEAILEARGVLLHRRTEIVRALSRAQDAGDDRYTRTPAAPPDDVHSDRRLAAVETSAGERIACDILAVAIGVRPRLRLAHTSGVACDRGILTDENLRTSAPDVFAAGDVAQARDPATREALLDTLWASAARQGRCAGANMTGTALADEKPPAMNVTRLAGITTTIVGAVGGGDDPDLVTLTRGQSERWHAEPDAWTLTGSRAGDRLRVVLAHDRIVGAVVMGDQTLSRPLARLIAGAADITALRPALEGRPDALVPLLLEFYHACEGSRAPRA